ncbi:hypothetical protein HMPREF0290_2010 [Corynebacterium efficiens YS-314]|nr:hypothetical protein HMPREF0290_2010 [Corynebacterium efficiens YS-314]
MDTTQLTADIQKTPLHSHSYSQPQFRVVALSRL